MDKPCYCGNSVDGDYCANIAALWNRQTLQPVVVDGQRTYIARVSDFDAPSTKPKRWLAFMIDIKFDNPYGLGVFGDVKDAVNDIIREKSATKKMFEKINGGFGGIPEDLGGYFEFTTQVIIWPNDFPYKDCYGADCGQKIV